MTASEVLRLESLLAAVRFELAGFARPGQPDDVVSLARKAKEQAAEHGAVSDDRLLTLLAVSEALLPFSADVDGTVVDKVRELVERWQLLEQEVVRLRASLQTCVAIVRGER